MVENNATIIKVPTELNESETMIRDETDRPILRSAISANVDIIITGDRDFLESGIDKPRILTARDFLDQFVS